MPQWAEAREKFDLALKLLDARHMSKATWAQFWAAQQRFFKYLCISAKVGRCVQLAEEAVKSGKVSAVENLQ